MLFSRYYGIFLQLLHEFLPTQSLLSWASLAPTNMCSTESVLYVTETLELDGDILDDSDSGLSPLPQSSENEGTIHLVKDPSCTARYFITHDYGVHAVAVPLVTKLSQLAAKDDGELQKHIVSECRNYQCFKVGKIETLAQHIRHNCNCSSVLLFQIPIPIILNYFEMNVFKIWTCSN